ncbi:16S rRNA (uracil(1498)-N(3))-methyltransferase [Mycoplasmopsis cricetuli]|uniref:16S rRNA (uracil(1498)-N(3))-methyltransferase n=1 Tax=Mycoplasmopsis cricetuli TaxID=171283 RepID=UPI0004717444|nr:16S rRNA (uracil(1498)-N(3))-methyltransferase [Mycoplasmopsis cricetuli]
MHRFFVTEKKDNAFLLDQKILKHIRVLKLENKEIICVYQNKFYVCIPEKNKASIVKQLHENHEYNFEVILAMSIIKLDHFEWLLQKATELGVTKIIPMITKHCNSDLVKFKFERKIERFKTILQNAAEQSFRNTVPILDKPQTFQQVINLEIKNKILAHEKINSNEKFNKKINSDVLFLIGPEGGFSDDEIIQALDQKFKIISLGSRILRAETAAIYLLCQLEMNAN